LHNKDKASSEAIKLMVASAGNRANTKADFRRMAPAKVIAILKQKYGVTDAVLEKLDRRKKMLLLQKKSRDAVSAGSQNKIALRYARLTGSRKVFAKNEYMKKIKKMMKQHLLMLRGPISATNSEANDDLDDEIDFDVDMDDDDEDAKEEIDFKNKNKKRRRTK